MTVGVGVGVPLSSSIPSSLSSTTTDNIAVPFSNDLQKLIKASYKIHNLEKVYRYRSASRLNAFQGWLQDIPHLTYNHLIYGYKIPHYKKYAQESLNTISVIRKEYERNIGKAVIYGCQTVNYEELPVIPSLKMGRMWMTMIMLLLSGIYISDNKDNIRILFDGIIKTMWTSLIGFLREYIIAPCLSVYEVIRYGNSRLKILGEEGADAEFKSLELMITDYAKRNYKGDRLDDIKEKAKKAEISELMRDYEKQINKPLTNAVFGDVIQLALIQIQKTKCEVALAMTALDSLLKSNELNFAFLTLIPAAWSLNAMKNWIVRSSSRSSNVLFAKTDEDMRKSLLKIDRLLTSSHRYYGNNNNNNNNNINNNIGSQLTKDVNYEQVLDEDVEGQIASELFFFYEYICRRDDRIPDFVQDDVKDQIIFDVKELLNPSVPLEFRRRALDRIWRVQSWHFQKNNNFF